MDSKLKFPISTNTLQAGLPHRPPMVWVRSVIFADEMGGICEAMLEPGSHEFGEHTLRQSSLLEWMVQGYGFAQHCVTGRVPQQVFLAQAQNIEFCSKTLWDEFTMKAMQGTRAFIEGRLVRQLGEMVMIQSKVVWDCPQKFLLASGQFKLYQT